MKRILALAVLSTVLASCAAFELTPEQKLERENSKKIGIVNTISASEITQFNDLGPVSCRVHWKNADDIPAENCRNELKLQAYRLGADLVVVESHDSFECTGGIPDKDCIQMFGHAYGKKKQ